MIPRDMHIFLYQSLGARAWNSPRPSSLCDDHHNRPLIGKMQLKCFSRWDRRRGTWTPKTNQGEASSSCPMGNITWSFVRNKFFLFLLLLLSTLFLFLGPLCSAEDDDQCRSRCRQLQFCTWLMQIAGEEESEMKTSTSSSRGLQEYTRIEI